MYVCVSSVIILLPKAFPRMLIFIVFLLKIDLPPRSETFDKNTGTRVVTEYKVNDEGKKVKVVKTYKVETRRVSKCVAKRKVSCFKHKLVISCFDLFYWDSFKLYRWKNNMSWLIVCRHGRSLERQVQIHLALIQQTLSVLLKTSTCSLCILKRQHKKPRVKLTHLLLSKVFHLLFLLMFKFIVWLVEMKWRILVQTYQYFYYFTVFLASMKLVLC